MTIALWDRASGEVLWQMPAQDDCFHLSFSSDGQRVLAYSTECSLVVRDTNTGRRIVTLPIGAEGRRAHAVYSHDRDTAVALTESGQLRFWEARSWRESR